jgi:murein DD-endopeptidase MepM/ murein hydrolase activator NlpD
MVPAPLEALTSAGLADRDDPDARTQALNAEPTPQQTISSSLAAPTPTPLPPPVEDPACDMSQSKLYCVYTVASGDTLSGIAVKFSLKGNEEVSAAELLIHSNKPDLASPTDLLQIGQKIRVPTSSAVLHTVLSDQTLTEIAAQYDVETADILSLRANNLADADNLKVGQELLVADPKRFRSPAPAAPPPPPAAVAAAAEALANTVTTTASTTTARASSAGFIWPTGGPISSYFGPGHPLGIDIDLYAAPNAPIAAAAAGTVTFAGGNSCCSYGLYVVVDHGNGYTTLYAHLSKISVSVGQSVKQGAVLGAGGRTGYSTGNHLHFEVHQNGSIINPMRVLP